MCKAQRSQVTVCRYGDNPSCCPRPPQIFNFCVARPLQVSGLASSVGTAQVGSISAVYWEDSQEGDGRKIAV